MKVLLFGESSIDKCILYFDDMRKTGVLRLLLLPERGFLLSFFLFFWWWGDGTYYCNRHRTRYKMGEGWLSALVGCIIRINGYEDFFP